MKTSNMENTSHGIVTTQLKKHNEDPTADTPKRALSPVKTPAHSGDVRHDWILYTVPSFAFVLGLVLFTLVCKTQSHRKARRFSGVKGNTNGTTVRHSDQSPECTEHFVDNQSNLRKNEAQSYENVTAAIYNNQDNVTYYVSPDEDYITPDAVGDGGAVPGQNQNDHLQVLTDTGKHTHTHSLNHTHTHTLPVVVVQAGSVLFSADGESYENMEGCVYARPRRNALKHSLTVDDDDYIHPDGEPKVNLEQTDTESYENMFGSVCPLGDKPAAHSSTYTIDDELYIHMDSIQLCDGASEDKMGRGEREERERPMERDRPGKRERLGEKGRPGGSEKLGERGFRKWHFRQETM